MTPPPPPPPNVDFFMNYIRLSIISHVKNLKTSFSTNLETSQLPRKTRRSYCLYFNVNFVNRSVRTTYNTNCKVMISSGVRLKFSVRGGRGSDTSKTPSSPEEQPLPLPNPYFKVSSQSRKFDINVFSIIHLNGHNFSFTGPISRK